MKNNWSTKKLGEVADVIMGQSPPSSSYNERGEGLPFFQGKAEFGEIYPIPVKYCSSPNRIAEANDILISVRAPVGNINIAKEKSCVGRGLGALRAKKNILNQMFLFYFMKKNENNWAKLSTGSTFSAIKGSSLRNFEIPLLPLATQKQIVDRLDKIAEAQNLNDGLIQKTDELFQSLLHKELNPTGKDWEVKNLGEVSVLVRGPFGGSLRRDIFVESGDCVYEQGNVINNNLENFRYFITSEKFKEMKRFEVSTGDILMSCSGTIGKFAMIPRNLRKGIINQALLKITPNKKIIGDFLKLTLEKYFSSNNIHVKGIAIKNIAAVKELKQIKIPVPPLKIQKQIITKLSAVQDYRKQLLEQKTKLKELFDSALTKSFK